MEHLVLPLTSIRRYARSIGPVLMLTVFLTEAAFAQSSACDLDASGSVSVTDVNRAVGMVLGSVPCTANVEGAAKCTIVTVQRVINSALGQPCVTYNSATRTVTVKWLASPSAGVAGYNVYRRTTPTGTPTKLNSAVVVGTTYLDTAIQLGQTYYYSATSVGTDNIESAESGQAAAIIPNQ